MTALFYDKFGSKYNYWYKVLSSEKYLKYSYINNRLLHFLFSNKNYGIEKIINIDTQTVSKPNPANNIADTTKLFIKTMQGHISPSIVAALAIYMSQYIDNDVITPDIIENILEKKNYDLLLFLLILKIDFFDEEIRIKQPDGITESKRKDDEEIKQDFVNLIARYLINIIDYRDTYNKEKISATALRYAVILLHTIYLEKLDEGLEYKGLEYNFLIEQAISQIIVAAEKNKLGKYAGKLHVMPNKLEEIKTEYCNLIISTWQEYYGEIRNQEITKGDIDNFFAPVAKHFPSIELIKEIKDEVCKSIGLDDNCSQRIKMIIGEYKSQHNHPGWLTILENNIKKGLMEEFGITFGTTQSSKEDQQKIVNKSERRIKRMEDPLWFPWDIAKVFSAYLYRSIIDINYESIRELPARLYEDNIFLFNAMKDSIATIGYAAPIAIAALATSAVFLTSATIIPTIYIGAVILTDFYREEPYMKPAMEQMAKDFGYITKIVTETTNSITSCVGFSK